MSTETELQPSVRPSSVRRDRRKGESRTRPLLQTETAVSAPFWVVQTPPLKLQLFLHLCNSSSCVIEGVSGLLKSLSKPKSIIFSAVDAVYAAYDTLM